MSDTMYLKHKRGTCNNHQTFANHLSLYATSRDPNASFPNVNGATLKAMQKCAGGWKWPEKDDEIDYLEKDIIRKIGFPVPVKNCGTYRV